MPSTRRTFLRQSLAAALAAPLAPAIVRASQSIPALPHGVAIGDAGPGRTATGITIRSIPSRRAVGSGVLGSGR